MPTPRPVSAVRRGLHTLLVALLVAGSAGCADGPAPRAWASSVCRALGPWRAEIDTLTTRAQQQMTAETTPAQAKENLVRLFGGAEAASESARRAVERAGVPDVDGGERVFRGFLESLTAVRDAYGRARQNIAALDTARADPFYTAVRQVVETLNTEYKASTLDTSRLNSEELKRAFDEVPECR